MSTDDFDPIKYDIERGLDYPFDADEDGSMPVSVTPERKAAYGILANLQGRRSIKQGFAEIDLDVREEIVETLAAIIKESVLGEGYTRIRTSPSMNLATEISKVLGHPYGVEIDSSLILQTVIQEQEDCEFL